MHHALPVLDAPAIALRVSLYFFQPVSPNFLLKAARASTEAIVQIIREAHNF